MALDIRMPIGFLFLILGALLAVYGLVTGFRDPAMYERSLGIDVNLWWGLVMMVFGAIMTAMGRRGLGDRTSGPSETTPVTGPRAH